ncbi:MAG: hypothetical protein IJV14_07560 [Lachnospiraceae bacterium]|nr:hypothetical protein [Lachnospiraceae bacterium]
MAARKLISFIIAFSTFILLAGAVLVLAASLQMTIVFRQNVQNDLFDYVPENLPVLLALMAASLLGMFFLYRSRRFRLLCSWRDNGRFRIGKILEGLLVFVLLYGLFLIYAIRGVATNDALQLNGIIGEFMQGNYSALNDAGYLGSYPFQIGYVMIGQILYRIAGPGNFLVYQILNLISIILTVYCLYRITAVVFHSEAAAELMTVLGFGALFYYTYTTFVYNDVWSIFLQTAAMYMQAVYLTEKQASTAHAAEGKTGRCPAFLYEIAAAVLIALGYLLKSNCLIALIAMIIVLLFSILRDLVSGMAGNGKRADLRAALQKTLMIVLLIVMTFGCSRLVNAHYAAAAGLEAMPKGVPTTSYLAMGMMEGEEGKAGWYNGFNVGVYRDHQYDWDAANAASIEQIRSRFADFMSSKRRMVRFYCDKFISQWGDGTCVSLREQELTGRHAENQPAVGSWLTFGTGYRIIGWVMNVYHSLIYLGVVIYCFDLFRRLRALAGVSEAEAMLVIFIIGGMLFHELWEASGRYVIRYYLMMLPLAAYGYSAVFGLTGRHRGENRKAY